MADTERSRSENAVPRWAWAAVVVLLVAAVVTVVAGRHQQDNRRIPPVVSASISEVGRRDATVAGPVSVTAVAATTLAASLNALPRPLTGSVSCPAEVGLSYLIHFTTRAGPTVTVSVDDGGCADVQLNSAGWNHSDRNGAVRAELARDLKSG